MKLRSSRSEKFCKKSVLKIFPKFTGKHLYQTLFLNKVAGLRPATLLKKRMWHKYFPVNFAKFLRTSVLKNICERLLLLKFLIFSWSLILKIYYLVFLGPRDPVFNITHFATCFFGPRKQTPNNE